MEISNQRKAGTAAIAGTGLIHLILAPEYFGEQAYIGALFVLGAIACGLVAMRLWRRDDAATWGAGALDAIGMGVGFVLSRTTGLPGFHEGEWELSGIVSLFLEAGFVGIAMASISRTRQASLAGSAA